LAPVVTVAVGNSSVALSATDIACGNEVVFARHDSVASPGVWHVSGPGGNVWPGGLANGTTERHAFSCNACPGQWVGAFAGLPTTALAVTGCPTSEEQLQAIEEVGLAAETDTAFAQAANEYTALLQEVAVPNTTAVGSLLLSAATATIALGGATATHTFVNLTAKALDAIPATTSDYQQAAGNVIRVLNSSDPGSYTHDAGRYRVAAAVFAPDRFDNDIPHTVVGATTVSLPAAIWGGSTELWAAVIEIDNTDLFQDPDYQATGTVVDVAVSGNLTSETPACVTFPAAGVCAHYDGGWQTAGCSAQGATCCCTPQARRRRNLRGVEATNIVTAMVEPRQTTTTPVPTPALAAADEDDDNPALMIGLAVAAGLVVMVGAVAGFGCHKNRVVIAGENTLFAVPDGMVRYM
jgi:hypothetical protein